MGELVLTREWLSQANQTRAAIESIPDGKYYFDEILDTDGVVWILINIGLDLTVEGSDAVFDISRSDPLVKGPLKAGISATVAAVFLSMKHMFPEIPINGGCYRPLILFAPEETF